jgi:Flp pilus assembly protein TadG
MKRLLRKFRRDEDGNATVEFTLWLPLIAGIIVGAFDLNSVLVAQSTMWDVARDTARRVSIGDLNATTGQEYALSRLTFMSFDYGVDITVGDDVVVTVQTYLSNVAVLGVMGGAGSYQLTAAVTMRNETE